MPKSPTIEITGFLVVCANGDMRTTKRRPALGLDELAFPVTVSIPNTWGLVQDTTITLSMPEPPQPSVTITGDVEAGASAAEEIGQIMADLEDGAPTQ